MKRNSNNFFIEKMDKKRGKSEETTKVKKRYRAYLDPESSADPSKSSQQRTFFLCENGGENAGAAQIKQKAVEIRGNGELLEITTETTNATASENTDLNNPSEEINGEVILEHIPAEQAGEELLDFQDESKTSETIISSEQVNDDEELDLSHCLDNDIFYECENGVIQQDEQPIGISQSDEPINVENEDQSEKNHYYFFKYGLDLPLYQNSPVTKFETLLMVLNIYLTFGATKELLKELLKFVNVILGTLAIPETTFLFEKIFNCNKLEINFFCKSCYLFFGLNTDGKKTTECQNCKCLNYLNFQDKNYFYTVDLEYQLKQIFEQHWNEISELKTKVTSSEEKKIFDVQDGLLFKKYYNDKMTLLMNTDGAAVFKSIKNSLWPIQCILNDLPPKLRFKFENRILFGAWFGEEAPKMDVFFIPFVQKMQKLHKQGMNFFFKGKLINIKLDLAICCTDSTAKPKMLNTVQFNGFSGCPYCFQKGCTLKDSSCRNVVYLYENAELRNHKTMINDAKKADELNLEAPTKDNRVNGVKGESILSYVPNFDLIDGMVIDYMHAVLLGVVKSIVCMWFDTSNRKEEYYIGNKIDQLDERLKNIKLPNFISRPVKSLREHGRFKANEWRSFLLYFSVPVLDGILPNKYLEHYIMLVNTIYIFLKEVITYEEIDKGNEILHSFVQDYQDLYGEANMRFNLHLLTHIGRCVSRCGPLWGYSAFSFESGNHFLIKFVNGTISVLSQICSKFIMTKRAAKYLQDLPISETVKEYCKNITSNPRNKISYTINKATFMGEPKNRDLTEEEIVLLQNKGIDPENSFTGHSLLVNNSYLIHEYSYTRMKRTFDSCVQFTNQVTGIVKKIVLTKTNDTNSFQLHLIFEPLICENVAGFPSHILKCRLSGNLEIISADSVVKKMIFLNLGENLSYVTSSPNEIEGD